ncbi:MAG: FKBP-type peptidyl-prolyl cis-trans isomerase [Verrucomicrobiota bacterium]
MKNIIATLFASVTLIAVSFAQEGDAAEPAPVDRDKAAYAIGLNIGNNFKANFGDINVDKVIEGIKDVLSGAEPKMKQDEVQEVLTALNREMQAEQQKKQEEMAAANIEKGKKYLEENGKREGVVTTASGLQYEIIIKGEGAIPTMKDKVKAIYKGELIDGSVFDDSRGLPRTFPVGGVIAGWTEALQLMPVGSKWKLHIPSDLAYGARQRGNVIEPNSVLVFELELVDIEKPVTATTPPVGIDLKTGETITATTPPVEVKPAEEAPKSE